MIVIRGNEYQSGTYVLFIHLSEGREVVFGRFQKGTPINLTPGMYIYIGSAMGKRGASSLGNRLQRHTIRNENSTHKIFNELRSVFDSNGIQYTQNPTKTLFWNIDHLLELEEASIVGIFAERSRNRREGVWSKRLNRLPELIPVAEGLGAHDLPGGSNLLKIIEEKSIESFINLLSDF